MAIENWKDMKSCGDEPSDCAKMKERSYGRAPVVSGNDNCPSELLSEEYPGIVMARSLSKTELASGSKKNPIKLPRLDKLAAESIFSLVGKQSDGTIVSWQPLERCVNRKVIATNGGFSLVYDQNSNVFDNACIGDISDVDYVAGAILFDDCEGNAKVQLKFFPVSQLITSS